MYNFFYVFAKDFIDNELKRRKRRARARNDDAEVEGGDDDAAAVRTPRPSRRPKGIKLYEHYESKRTKSRKPSVYNTTLEVRTETTNTKIRDGQPRRRAKLTYDLTHRKPKSDEIEGDDPTSEIEDLTDDDFFYAQLERRRPTTESSDEVEQVKDEQPSHVNRDIVYVHGLNHNKRRGKQRQKFAQISSDAAILADINEDTYDDYGEMEMPDSDVEMHDTYEPNTKEGHMQQAVNYAPLRPAYDQRPPYVSPTWRVKNPVMLNARPTVPMYTRPVPPMNLRPVPPMSARPAPAINARPMPSMNARPVPTMSPRPSNGMLAYGPPNSPKIVPIERPVHKQTFERITITKKLKTPDELHEEIDKIFQMKTENYNKKGHDKSHWELRIVPLRYKTHEEYGSN